jgi:hypothetical protein
MSLLIGLNAMSNGLGPTGIVFITESAQALSTPKEVLDNTSARNSVRINVYDACFFVIQTRYFDTM